MARKSSDMVLLLGSRGQHRRNNGFGASLFRTVGSLFGTFGLGFGRRTGSRRMELGRSSRTVSAWVAFGGALVCFAGGFLVGDHFAAAKVDPGAAGLNASAKAPGFIGETDTRRLTGRAFVVAAYANMPAADAKGKAKALSDWLRAEGGLPTARPYEFPAEAGPLWVVAVYFDGDTDKAAKRADLHKLPENVPDPVFCQLRKGTPGWPEDYSIR